MTGFGLPSQKKTDGGSVAQEKVEEGERGGGGGGVGKKRGGGGSKGGKKGGKGRGREQPLEDLGKPASWEYKFMTSDEVYTYVHACMYVFVCACLCIYIPAYTIGIKKPHSIRTADAC